MKLFCGETSYGIPYLAVEKKMNRTTQNIYSSNNSISETILNCQRFERNNFIRWMLVAELCEWNRNRAHTGDEWLRYICRPLAFAACVADEIQ